SSRYGPPSSLPPFPTRRSSDLAQPPAQEKAIYIDSEITLDDNEARTDQPLPPLPSREDDAQPEEEVQPPPIKDESGETTKDGLIDRKSTRLNSSHVKISYAVFC